MFTLTFLQLHLFRPSTEPRIYWILINVYIKKYMQLKVTVLQSEIYTSLKCEFSMLKSFQYSGKLHFSEPALGVLWQKGPV